MDTALPILLFLGFLFGSTLLILVCGVYSPDREEAQNKEDRLAALDLRTMPRFFGRPGQAALPNPVAVVVDEPLVLRVEEFLRAELELAEVFVSDPSVEGLHRRPVADEVGPSVFERLEGFLRDEQDVAARFVSAPSVESLYGRFEVAPAVA